jgi:hypothetical protein
MRPKIKKKAASIIAEVPADLPADPLWVQRFALRADVISTKISTADFGPGSKENALE